LFETFNSKKRALIPWTHHDCDSWMFLNVFDVQFERLIGNEM
jgi:hypothetical protein